MIARVKGTHDFLDLILFNFFIEMVEKQCALYNFSEISTPILEHAELFKRSLGLQTDVVSKEMFIIQNDPSICLRPEATASTMRAFLEHGSLATPWKVYSYGSMFRYERPQKGRFRQFHQMNIEIIGSDAIDQDVQLIAMLDRLFQEKLMLDTYALQLNFLGCSNDRQAFKEILQKFLTNIEDKICQNCKVRKEHNMLRIFDCKVETCKELYQNAPEIAANLCSTCAQEWQTLQTHLQLLSISYSYNPRLVRGLDYYDKTVFEFVSSNLGAQNAFCGGGRYNGLARALGAKEDIPSLGAAIGIERILLLLEPIKGRLTMPQPIPLCLMLPLSKEQHAVALLLADTLHAHDLCVDILLDDDSLKSMMRKANKMGAHYCLLVGSEEQNAREVTIKNMVTGHEEKIKQVDLVTYLTDSVRNK